MLHRASFFLLFIPLLHAQSGCDPAAFGAKADGQTKDTAAIQGAIDSCAQSGGGTVRLSAGVYLSAPLALKTGVTLQIDSGVKLLGSSDTADYAAGPALVSANGQTDIGIAGQGTIAGAVSPSQLVAIAGCQRVNVQGVTLTGSTDTTGTDGIVILSSHNVTVSNVTVDTGGADIAIRSAGDSSDTIGIADSTFLRGLGLTIGSATSGGVRSVTVQRCSFKGTANGLVIQSDRGEGGEVSLISYSDITMDTVGSAIFFSGYFPAIPDTDSAQPVTPLTPFYHDIKVTNLTATGGASAGSIIGLPETPFSGVLFDHVNITADAALVVRNASMLVTSTPVPFILQDAAFVGLYLDPAAAALP